MAHTLNFWITPRSRLAFGCPPISRSPSPKVGWCAPSTIARICSVSASGKRSRIIVATHPAGAKKSRIGKTRDGVIYELFFTNLAPTAFTAADIVALSLHRGSA